jgi:hypothetical protein
VLVQRSRNGVAACLPSFAWDIGTRIKQNKLD